MTKQKIYGVTVPLLEDVKGVECWNFTDRSKHDLPAGTLVTLDNENDATHTTVCLGVKDEYGRTSGMPLIRADGQTQLGYRFIIPNKVLRKATGLKVPLRTGDLVGNIIAFESGELTVDQAEKLLRKLKKSGMLGGLQGSYSAAAERLGV